MEVVNNNDQDIMQTPHFNNLQEECNFWKDSAIKWKAKYENAKRLYAETLCKSNSTPLKKRYGLSKPAEAVVNESKSVVRGKDPFDTKVLGLNLQAMIVRHLNQKDFLKMTQVSRKWKKIFESNQFLDKSKVSIDLSAVNTAGQELLESKRRYKSLEINHSQSEELNCLRILNKFSSSLEQATIYGKNVSRCANMRGIFPRLQKLKFTGFLSDNFCRFLNMSDFDELQELHIRRIRQSETLMLFLLDLPALMELHIAADFAFYYGWLEFVENVDSFDPENSLVKLHVEIIDYDDSPFMSVFLPHAETLEILKFSGICQMIHVAQGLMFFRQLEELIIGFNQSDKEDDAMEDEELNPFDDDLEPHTVLEKLVILDVDIIKFENFKTLLLYTPNVRILHIYSIINREIMHEIIVTLPVLHTLVYSSIKEEALDHLAIMRSNNNVFHNANFDLKPIEQQHSPLNTAERFSQSQSFSELPELLELPKLDELSKLPELDKFPELPKLAEIPQHPAPQALSTNETPQPRAIEAPQPPAFEIPQAPTEHDQNDDDDNDDGMLRASEMPQILAGSGIYVCKFCHERGAVMRNSSSTGMLGHIFSKHGVSTRGFLLCQCGFFCKDLENWQRHVETTKSRILIDEVDDLVNEGRLPETYHWSHAKHIVLTCTTPDLLFNLMGNYVHNRTVAYMNHLTANPNQLQTGQLIFYYFSHYGVARLNQWTVQMVKDASVIQLMRYLDIYGRNA